MSSKQTRKLIIVMAGILFVWILSPLAGFRPPPTSQSTTALLFDAHRAYQTINEFVTQCPNRILGSFESRHATGYLRDRLAELGYEPDYTQFSSWITRSKEVGRNVLGYKAGVNPEIIALVAHCDTAKTTVQGAMDNGSGVGVLLEIARIFASSPTNRSLLIIFSDGGEWGMLGALDIATRYTERSRIAAVLSLDHVGIGDLEALRLDETGLLKGFTPPWYRMLALRAAEEQGLPVIFASGLKEHIERVFYIPKSDQGPFLNQGIPAINLGSQSVNRVFEQAVYHSPQDTIENLEISGVESFGLAAERIVRTLDESPSIPEESMNSFRLWHALFLGPKTIRFLHGIVFLPLPICLFFHLRNHHRSLKPMAIGREIIGYLATLLPFLTVYFLIGLFRGLQKLPVYTLYPATAKDAVLQNPSWWILGIVFGTALIIAALCILFYMFAFREYSRQNFNVSKTILLALMLITVVLALLYNSYWAGLFLSLPCWIWILIGPSRHFKSRILHWTLTLVAALPYCTILWHLASQSDMGWNFIWYHTLALNTGLFSGQGFFMGAAAAALGIRFLVIQLHD